MNTVTITIGWTIHHEAPRDELAYMPFYDDWAPGQAQHVETITVALPDLLEHPVEITEASLAESVFIATNAPEVDEDSIAGRILAAIQATGYVGREAHWSLSVGDTVTVNGAIWACSRKGWTKVGQVSPHDQDAILRDGSALAEAHAMARVTGAREATVAYERRNEDGSLTTEGAATSIRGGGQR